MVIETGIKPFREIGEDGLVRLNFHPGQTKAWESTKRFVFLLGGAQSGKTCWGPHWLLREIQRCGPGDYLAITATYPLLRLKMLPEFLYVFDTLFHLGVWRESDRVFVMHNGTRVIFGSATNPESIESATAKAAWLDELGQEQFRRDAWDAVLRRLSLAKGRVLGTTTLYGYTWLKGEVFDRWEAGDPDIDVIQVDSIVNPAFPRDEYERARRTLPAWKFQLYYRGRYDKPAGLIYDVFDEQVCKLARFALPLEWPRYVGHDFGGVNTAAVWYAQDPGTGYLYVYRTYLKGGLSAYDHAQEFKRLSEGENIVKRVGGAQHEDGWRESFTAAGWPIAKPRQRDVEVGIDAVYGWHKKNSLFVFDDMKDYLDEKLSYSRKLDDKYEPTDEIRDKASYHLMDGERYLLSDFAPEAVEGMRQNKVHRFRDV